MNEARRSSRKRVIEGDQWALELRHVTAPSCAAFVFLPYAGGGRSRPAPIHWSVSRRAAHRTKRFS